MRYILKINILFFSLLLLTSSALEKTIAQKKIKHNNLQQNKITSVTAKLEQQLAENKITIDEWAKNIAYSIFEPGKLPLEYKNLERDGLQTWILSEIFNNWNKLNISTKLELQKYGFTNNGALAPPSGLDSTRETTHFKFHYSVASGDTNAITSTDTDNNGTPDYLDSMMTVLEHVWSFEIDSMGYTAPPPDNVNGGNSKYDVYIFKLSPGTFGFVAPDSLTKDNPNSTVTETYSATSHMAMRNEYSNFTDHTQLEDIQVTAAHEFFHSIQAGYDVFIKSWMKEATSTWMEDELYDNINDNYQYMPNWFLTPWVSLDATNAQQKNHWYGSWIFFRYLSEHVGGRNTIKQIIEKTLDYDNYLADYSYNEISDILSSHGTNFEKVFQDFTVTNLIKNIPPYDYAESANYPNINKLSELFGTTSVTFTINRLSSMYFPILANIISSGNDDIIFDLKYLSSSVQGSKIGLQIVLVKNDTVNVIKSPVQAGNYTYTLTAPSTYDAIYAIVINPSLNTADFKLSIQTSQGLLYRVYQSNNTYPLRTFINSNNTLLRVEQDINSGNILLKVVDLVDQDLQKEFNANNYQGNYLQFSTSLAKHTNEYTWSDYDESTFKGKYYAHYNGQNITWALGPQDNTPSTLTHFKPSFMFLPQIDSGFVWFAGEKWANNQNTGEAGLWLVNLSTKSNSKVLNVNNYPDYFVVDGKMCAVQELSTNTDEIDLVQSSGTSRTIYSVNKDSSRINLLEFNDGIICFEETTNDTLFFRIYKVTTGAVTTLAKAYVWDQNHMLALYTMHTKNGRVVWIEINRRQGILNHEVYLWVNGTKTKIYNTTGEIAGYVHGGGNSHYENAEIAMDNKNLIWLEAPGGFSNSSTRKLTVYNFSGNFLQTIDSRITTQFFENHSTKLIKMNNDKLFFSSSSGTSGIGEGIYFIYLNSIITSVDSKNVVQPLSYKLYQNYPNPFNPSTTISYQIPVPGKVTLKIYDILGREVTTLVNKEQKAGNYKVNFDASRLASGVYFYRIIAGDFVQTKKMILLK